MDTFGSGTPGRSPADLRRLLERCWREARLDYEEAGRPFGAAATERAVELAHGKIARASPGGTASTQSCNSEDKERFFDKVDRTGECWRWTATTDDGGYGRFWVNGSNRQWATLVSVS